MRALVIGYGRAGRRLGRGLDTLGVEWSFYDPNPNPPDNWQDALASRCKVGSLEQALSKRDFAIIATPPTLHLSQIRQCLDAGLPVLCEKPLCAFGQLQEAEELMSHPLAGKVGMAFNYRWHPRLDSLSYFREDGSETRPYSALSAQHRPEMPEWGLILDHLPHTIDTLLWLSGAETMTVERASHRKNSDLETVAAGGLLPLKGIHGVMTGQKWNLADTVFSHPVNKVAWIDGPFGLAQVETPPDTVDRMSQAMLAQWISFVQGQGEYPVTLEDGIKVQRVLEQIKERI